MAITTIASKPTHAPIVAASTSPPPKRAAATTIAARLPTKPAGIGFPGFKPASRGASTTSLLDPMPSWSSVIARPAWIATLAGAPPMAATEPLTSPSSTDGNGWVRRIQPRSRFTPGRRRASDVDEFAEVRDEILDEPVAAVGNLRADPWDQREERDRRHDQAAVTVSSHDRGRAAARSEHPFETSLVQA